MATADRPGVETWMLPGELARAAEPPAEQPATDTRAVPTGRRTARDWAVDATVFLVAVAGAVAEQYTTLRTLDLPGWLHAVDVAVGALLCLALWWRRQFPVAVALLAVVAIALSNTGTVAAFVALFSLALHRGWRWALPVALASVATGAPYLWVYLPPSAGSPVMWVVLVAAMLLLVTTAGLAVRARRQVVLVLREQADAAHRVSEMRLERARQAEREQIAREMHDVLAHRISLLAVHSGALEYRAEQAAIGAARPPEPAELAESAGVIRRNAHVALEELRGVLQVLRGIEPDRPTAPPPPGLAQVPELVEEVDASGQRVRLRVDAGDVPDSVGRTVYRVVQEGLTNARKHAPGAAVDVTVRTDGALAVVEVANAVPVGVTPAELAGARVGLDGLAERVRAHRDGARTGTLQHGLAPDGTFRLTARIPWAA